MQAVAAEFSRCRRRIPLLFYEKSLKSVCLDPSISKQALKRTRSVCLRAPHGRARVKIEKKLAFGGFARQNSALTEAHRKQRPKKALEQESANSLSPIKSMVLPAKR